jgi:UDP-N-acetylmuramate dehydrogenase
MQNIGAYGVEIKDVLLDVEAMDLHSQEQVIFSSKECHFGYRDSIFKKDAKGRFFITAIRIKLSRRNHQLNISYGAIQDVLEAEGIKKPKIADVSRAVIKIRQSKLPDPDILGNSGSFFKNPVIPLEKFDELKKEYADLPSYKVEGGQIKLAAGWLIESLGWKGKRIGNTGSHKDQALVLVNYGNASGSEIEELSLAIQESVKTKYGIELETEVNIIKK